MQRSQFGDVQSEGVLVSQPLEKLPRFRHSLTLQCFQCCLTVGPDRYNPFCYTTPRKCVSSYIPCMRGPQLGISCWICPVWERAGPQTVGRNSPLQHRFWSFIRLSTIWSRVSGRSPPPLLPVGYAHFIVSIVNQRSYPLLWCVPQPLRTFFEMNGKARPFSHTAEPVRRSHRRCLDLHRQWRNVQLSLNGRAGKDPPHRTNVHKE